MPIDVSLQTTYFQIEEALFIIHHLVQFEELQCIVTSDGEFVRVRNWCPIEPLGAFFEIILVGKVDRAMPQPQNEKRTKEPRSICTTKSWMLRFP
jgi:hypothetical protein